MAEWKIERYNDNIKRLKDIVGSEENIDLYLMEYNQYPGHKVTSEYISKKKIAVIDCDGVISNGKSYYTKDGKLLKPYGCYDKEMMRLLTKYRWEFLFVSDDNNGIEITKRRINDIKPKTDSNIEFKQASAVERYQIVKELKNTYDLVVFIGDSLSDIPSLVVADIQGCPKNAPNEVKEFSKFISDYEGGNGAVADILYTIHRFNGEI